MSRKRIGWLKEYLPAERVPINRMKTGKQTGVREKGCIQPNRMKQKESA